MTNNIEARGDARFYNDDKAMDYTKLYQIDEAIEAILQKKYGKDVRYAIASALKRIYYDAAQSGNANLEVSLARGKFTQLADRLNSIVELLESKADDGQVESMLNNILDGSPKGTYNDIGALRSALPSGAKGIYITTNNGHWNYWNGSNWVDGGAYQSPLNGVPNQLGVIFDGLLTIDRDNQTVSIKKDTWFTFGNKNYAPEKDITIMYNPSGLSEYVVYDFQNKNLSVITLSDISKITSTQVILAVMYKNALHYPTYSQFIKTIGYRELTQDTNIGSVVQGNITYDNRSQTFSFKGFGEKNEIIVSKGTSYFTCYDQEDLAISSGFLHHLVFDLLDNKFKLVRSSLRRNAETFTAENTKLLIASIYLDKLTHYSNPYFIKRLGELENLNSWELEELIVNLQTKKTVVVTLGDSTTDGYRTSNYSGNELESLMDKPKTYTQILNGIVNQQKGYNFNHKFYNRGFSGKTIAWLNQNLNEVLKPIPEKIDYAFITMGINDLVYNDAKVKAFKQDYINVINKLLSRGIKPLLMSTQAEFENFNRFGNKINAIADNVKREIAKEFGIPFIDYNRGTQNILSNSEYDTRLLIPDMCHFADLGHQKGAEFLASKLIAQTVIIKDDVRIGYASNKVNSDLVYSDYQNDEQKDVKWITRTDGFDLEGRLNFAQTKTMFEVSVYIERPSIIRYFGDNVIVTSNGQALSDGAVLDVGFYRITAKNRPGVASKFRGLKFNLKEV